MKNISETLEDKVMKKIVSGEGLEIAKGIRIYSVMSEFGEIVPMLNIDKYAKNEIQKYSHLWNSYSNNK